MTTHLPCLRRALLASGLATLIIASSASAATNKTAVDIRVVDSDGSTLNDTRQYTGTTTVKTSKQADCFGQGTGGSGDKVKVPGATALGVVSDASRWGQQLEPLSITDAFDFGLGVCGFGDAIAPSTGYWYLKQNHVGSMTGGDQTAVKNGDDILWYLIEDYNQPTPSELEIKAPYAAELGKKVPVQVFQYADDGTKTPAAGATIKGTGVVTGADGTAQVPATAGLESLQAVRAGAIPSRALAVCVTDDPGNACTAERPLETNGSIKDDKIKADPKRLSEINSGRGDDKIDIRNVIKDSASPRISCGDGKDVILAGKKQQFDAAKNCEKVKQS